MRFFKSKEQKEAEESARRSSQDIVGELATATPEGARELAARLSTDPSLAVLSEKERAAIRNEAFTRYAEGVLADDLLTEDEEKAFEEVVAALGLDLAVLAQPPNPHAGIYPRLLVAKINDGRLETIDDPTLIAKGGEIVHEEIAAALMKEVILKEFRGGSQGMSFRVAKGVRYRVGGFRGHAVVVGKELQVQDVGTLSVTSSRVVYLGEKKTTEFLYSKLVGCEVFDDGLRLQVSNRQTTSLFKLNPGWGHVVAATINAAMQRTL